ncbi:MAG: glycosyltransferase family 4 protein [Agriterribacter sp.]
MPKVLLGVSSSFCAHFLRGQVNYLVEHGYEVVIMSGPGREIETLAKEEKAKLIPIAFTKKITPLTDLFQLFKIIRILRKEKPDAINAGNPKSGFLIMLACYFAGFENRVFTLHGLVSDSKTGMLKALMTLTEKISCNIAKRVIVVSPSLKAHAEQRNILLPHKGLVIEKGSSNGIDLQKFSRTGAVMEISAALKNKYGLHENHFVICFIGRLTKDKGIDILFETFNRLTPKYNNIKLLIAGPIIPENPFSPEFMERLNNDARIIFMGEVSDIVPVYAIADILVLPSFREGLPNVLLEAAALEVPVIASDIPGCRDAVQDGHTGLLFEKGNVDALVNSIEKLVSNPGLRKVYGKNGRQFAASNFDNRKIWHGQLNIYETMRPHYQV